MWIDFSYQIFSYYSVIIHYLILSLRQVSIAQIFLIDFENRYAPSRRDKFFFKANINFTRSKFSFERNSILHDVFLKLTRILRYGKMIKSTFETLTVKKYLHLFKKNMQYMLNMI